MSSEESLGACRIESVDSTTVRTGARSSMASRALAVKPSLVTMLIAIGMLSILIVSNSSGSPSKCSTNSSYTSCWPRSWYRSIDSVFRTTSRTSSTSASVESSRRKMTTFHGSSVAALSLTVEDCTGSPDAVSSRVDSDMSRSCVSPKPATAMSRNTPIPATCLRSRPRRAASWCNSATSGVVRCCFSSVLAS